MDVVSSPTDLQHRAQEGSEAQPHHHSSGLVPSHGISIDVEPPSSQVSQRPQMISHVSTPAYESPLRHHRRAPSAPRHVKESLNARSEYVTSQDDGTAQHRLNQYIIKQEIGRGSFGAVHLAVDQYGEEYAVKEFSKSRLRKRAQSHILRGPRQHRQRGNLAPDDFNSPLHRKAADDPTASEESTNSIDLIREEIAIMKKLNHHNLVSLIEVLDDPKEDSLYMVLEMCKKGVVMKVGLGETADPYTEEQCRCWFRDLILGIEYLHAQGIVHRDIKPDNCLLTRDDVLKIVDFGVSEMFEKDSEMLTAKSAGSPAFLPPELCVVRHGGISGKAADIWSMGVTLYCLRFGKIPFEKTAILELYEAIRNDDVQVPAPKEDAFCDLMLRILEKDPQKRIKMEELRNHRWVTRNGTDPLLSAEENTDKLVEPPTQSEVNRAITTNMKNLVTVMKAVHKFKALLNHKRPSVMNSILKEEGTGHMSQPPLDMKHDDPTPPHNYHKSHSTDAQDRRPIEGALVTEGVHRNLTHTLPISGGRLPDDRNLGALEKSQAQHETASPNAADPASWQPSKVGHDLRRSSSPDFDDDNLPPFTRSDLLTPSEGWRKALTMSENLGTRGHARDPLEDHLYLYVGASTFSGVSPADERRGSFMPDEDDLPIVSESPGAAEIDIYETAYRDEIEKIRKRLLEEGRTEEAEEPEVFLTRRVDARLLALGSLAGRVRAKGEEGFDRVREIKALKQGRARVSGISRALRVAAHEEYERRRQERRARETVESAKAEADKAKQPDQEASTQPNPSQGGEGESGSASPKTSPGPQAEDQGVGARPQASLFSSVSGKAWEKGRQAAKTSFRGIYGKAREYSTKQSSGSSQGE